MRAAEGFLQSWDAHRTALFFEVWASGNQYIYQLLQFHSIIFQHCMNLHAYARLMNSWKSWLWNHALMLLHQGLDVRCWLLASCWNIFKHQHRRWKHQNKGLKFKSVLYFDAIAKKHALLTLMINNALTSIIDYSGFLAVLHQCCGHPLVPNFCPGTDSEPRSMACSWTSGAALRRAPAARSLGSLLCCHGSYIIVNEFRGTALENFFPESLSTKLSCHSLDHFKKTHHCIVFFIIYHYHAYIDIIYYIALYPLPTQLHLPDSLPKTSRPQPQRTSYRQSPRLDAAVPKSRGKNHHLIIGSYFGAWCITMHPCQQFSIFISAFFLKLFWVAVH